MMIPKPRVWRSDKYRRFVATLKCALPGCNVVGGNAHHEQERGSGKMGGKCDDSRVFCLCPLHHFYRHATGRGIFGNVYPERMIAATQEAWYAKHQTRPWRAP